VKGVQLSIEEEDNPEHQIKPEDAILVALARQ